MTPDLKRLCEVAEAVLHASTIIAPGRSGGGGSECAPQPSIPMTVTISTEAIVRAVLTALREPSADAIEAGRWPAEDDGPVACLNAMIDHILDTKARRASALSDLAALDGETL